MMRAWDAEWGTEDDRYSEKPYGYAGSVIQGFQQQSPAGSSKGISYWSKNP